MKIIAELCRFLAAFVVLCWLTPILLPACLLISDEAQTRVGFILRDLTKELIQG